MRSLKAALVIATLAVAGPASVVFAEESKALPMVQGEIKKLSATHDARGDFGAKPYHRVSFETRRAHDRPVSE